MATKIRNHQADLGGYYLEVDFPKDVEVPFPFEAAGSCDCKHDHDDRKAK